MGQLDVEGLRIAYERAGEGPPLILLHGFVGDSREWRRQIDGLSDEFTVVAWDAPGHPTGFRAMARSVAEADLRDVLPRIDVPTLLLYGDKDVRAPLNVAEDLHAAIPASRIVVMPGVGQMSSLEAAERFNAEVRTFLRSVHG